LITIWRASLLLLALWLAACSPQAPTFRSTDITGADFGRELALPGHDGKPHSLADFRGKLVVLFFGYTHCPDICPTTLADVAALMKKLGPDAARVQVLFVTVDPERDTPPSSRNMCPAFDASFLGLSGDAAATQRVAREFRSSTRSGRAARPAPTRWTTARSSMCWTRRAGCACWRATIASRRISPRTCAYC
jgi:protein SCO1/2